MSAEYVVFSAASYKFYQTLKLSSSMHLIFIFVWLMFAEYFWYLKHFQMLKNCRMCLSFKHLSNLANSKKYSCAVYQILIFIFLTLEEYIVLPWLCRVFIRVFIAYLNAPKPKNVIVIHELTIKLQFKDLPIFTSIFEIL